jgi:chromosome segregation ATPase
MRSLLSPTAKSPRGVGDVFLQVDSKEKLNSSLSWADNSTSSLKSLSSLSSPKKKSAKKVRIDSEKSWDGKKEKKTKKIKKVKQAPLKGTPAPIIYQSSDSTQQLLREAAVKGLQQGIDPDAFKIEMLKVALEETTKQLKEVNDRRKKDADEMKAELKQAKKECKKQLEATFKPVIDSNIKDGESRNKRQAETAKLIQYLKDDNAKIRKEIESTAQKIKELKVTNSNLERLNHQAGEAYTELEDQVETMKAVNDKLSSNLTIFKETLSSMKKDYKKRTAFHQIEINCSEYYDKCMGKVVKSVLDRSRDSKLIEDVSITSAEGIAFANEERQKYSPSADLESLPSPVTNVKKKKASWSFMFEDEVHSKSDNDSDDE